MNNFQDELDAIIARIENPENADLLKKAQQEMGLGILWHLKRAQNMLKQLPKSDGAKKVIQKSSFRVSVSIIKRKLDKHGWK